MRIAVFSDMHGNDLAFQAVVSDIQKQRVDQLVCLGDAIQGGSQPRETVHRLRTLGCPVVMGNADAWLLSGLETGHEDIPPERLKKMEEVRQWSLTKLDEEDREFIAGFQATVTIQIDEKLALLCFHGSPDSFDDVMAPEAPQEIFHKFLGAHLGKILTGGHTHAQQVRRLGEYFFFNPGSVGFAFSHDQPGTVFHADPWAEYAILSFESGQLGLEFRRVPIDAQELIRIYLESGRPFAEEAAAQYQR